MCIYLFPYTRRVSSESLDRSVAEAILNKILRPIARYNESFHKSRAIIFLFTILREKGLPIFKWTKRRIIESNPTWNAGYFDG